MRQGRRTPPRAGQQCAIADNATGGSATEAQSRPPPNSWSMNRKTLKMSRKMLGRDRDGAGHVGAAQPVEVEDREAAEDHQPGDGVDDVGVGDGDEDADDPEHDQRQQRPEQRARPGGEVAPRRVAVRAEAGDERRGRARPPATAPLGRPWRRRSAPGRRRGRAAARARTAAPIASCSRPRRGDVQAEDAGEGADEQDDPGAAAEVAPDVGAERGAADGEGDEAHDLAEHGPRAIACDRRGAGRDFVISWASALFLDSVSNCPRKR